MKPERMFFVLISCIILSFNNSFSQNKPPIDSLKIIEGIQDTSLKVSIIPKEALDGNYDLLVEGIYYGGKTSNSYRGYKIFWKSPLISGRNVIYVNPKQIYLRTEHDNPYPNHLYWIIDICNEQYISIEKVINEQNGNLLADKTAINSNYKTLEYNYSVEEQPIPYEWTYKEIISHKKDYKKKLYINFADILRSWNKAIPQKELQLYIPSFKEFSSVKPIRTLYLREEYGDEFNDIDYKTKQE
jgi:hypothetical protein